MTRLAEQHPDWPAEDWQDYYKNTVVVCPRSNKPSLFVAVQGLTNGSVIAQLKDIDTGNIHAVSVKEFKWSHLKHPRLGWIIVNNVPIYVIKKPLREKVKGFRRQLLDFILPGYLPMVGHKLGMIEIPPEKAKAVFLNVIKDKLSLDEFYVELPPLSLEAAVDVLKNTSALSVIMSPNRQNLLIKNHELREVEEFPYLFLHGPNIAGKVRKDLSIEQVGNVDIAEALYDNG